MPEPSDPEARNKKIVEEVRETLGPLVERLTPEVEPAITYVPYLLKSEPSKDSAEDK